MENIIAGVFGLLIGTVGVWLGFKQLGNRAALNKWNSTEGKVIERGTYRANIPVVSPPAFQHAPLVKYAYRVGGKEFVNSCIHPKRIQLPERNTRKWAQKRAESFADVVTVYYNPKDPRESFLIQTPKWKLYVLIGGSCVAILVGLMFLVTK